MNARVKQLTDAAVKLSPNERVERVEDILRSLDATDARIDGLWAKEAKDRFEAYRRGEIEALDFDAMMSKMRTRGQRS